MIKFRHKNGGVTSVFTEQNINYLRNHKDYTEIGAEAVEAIEKPKVPRKIKPVEQIDDTVETAESEVLE